MLVIRRKRVALLLCLYFGCGYVQGVRGHPKGEIPFSADDIQSIELTHKRWQWEW